MWYQNVKKGLGVGDLDWLEPYDVVELVMYYGLLGPNGKIKAQNTMPKTENKHRLSVDRLTVVSRERKGKDV
jgi:hypothetical protein